MDSRGQDFSFDITGCAAYPDEVLEPIVMRLERVIGNAQSGLSDRAAVSPPNKLFGHLTFQV